MVTVSLTIGTAVSLFCLFPIAETKGRKFATVYCRISLLFIAAVCQILSFFFRASEFFLLAQFIIGMGHPLRTFITIFYVTECSRDKNRGFASTVLIFSTVIGRMLFSIVMLLVTVKLPDSPKWLVYQNRIDEARTSIQYYHGSGCSIDKVIRSFTKEKNLTIEAKISFRQAMGDETLREAIGILLFLTLFFLLDSTSTQAVYTVSLHKDAGFTVQETMNISLILTIVFFPTKFIGTYIIDALGRRPVMILAGVICFGKSILMVITQVVIYFVGQSLLTKIMYVAVECLTGSIPATGVTSLHVLFISELFPPSARTSVAQVMIIIAMIIDTPLLAMFPFVYSYFPPGFFVPFAISQVICGIYLYRHMPETSGRAVCDIIESMEKTVTSRASTFDQRLLPHNIHIY
ncbi:hypothetical protein CRE_00909 [Caenorhabditis remanei]|uniref:Major facilitator superfamily (MFS) profile domain-containing protein n=1 Tax=Caenorhabditis remanei TaxID=31234 RepID=E3LCG2_CAERE|nr:hypothetical protein CRE_00909 [Caenorhabditis remanei]